MSEGDRTARLRVAIDPTPAKRGQRAAGRAFDDLKRQARDANQQVEQNRGSFQRLKDEAFSLRGVLTALAGSYVALKLAQQAREAVNLAARYETLGIVTRRLGDNAGYTAGQIDDVEQSLQDSGIAMVESRQAMARLIQAQVDLTNASDLARIAQDAAVIGATNSSEAFNRLTVGIQTGNLRILRSVGLNLQWEQSYRSLAQELGKTVGDLTEQERVQARVNAVIQAGAGIAGTYEDAMGTAGKMLGSMRRLVDDLKTSLGQVGIVAFTEAVFGSADALESMQKAVDDVGPERLREWGGVVADAAVALGAAGLAGAALLAVPAIQALAGAVGGLGVVLGTIAWPVGIMTAVGSAVFFWRRHQRSLNEELEITSEQIEAMRSSASRLNEEQAAARQARSHAMVVEARQSIREMEAQQELLRSRREALGSIDQHSGAQAREEARELDRQITDLDASIETMGRVRQIRQEGLNAVSQRLDQLVREGIKRNQELTDAQREQLALFEERRDSIRTEIADLRALAHATQISADEVERVTARLEDEAAIRREAEGLSRGQTAAIKDLVRQRRNAIDALEREQRLAEDRDVLSELQEEARQARGLAVAYTEGEDAVREYNRELAVMEAISRLSAEATDEITEKVRSLAGELFDMQEKIREHSERTGQDAVDPVKAAWEEAARGIQRTFADGFERVFTGGISGFKDFAREVLSIFQRLAAQIAAAMVIEKLGLDKILKELREGDLTALEGRKGTILGGVGAAAVGFGIGQATGPLGGALGGAASGAAIGSVVPGLGTAIGGVIGGVSGLVGGLFGSSKKAKEAAREMARAQRAWESALDDFRNMFKDIPQFERDRQRLEDQFQSLTEQLLQATDPPFALGILGVPESVEEWREFVERWPDDFSGHFIDSMRELLDAFDENAERLAELQAREQERFREDLEVRMLRAQGREGEADTLALELRHQRELEEARRKGFDKETLALLERIQEEERAAEAARDMAGAFRDATSALNDPSGLRLSLLRWRSQFDPSRDTAGPPGAHPPPSPAEPPPDPRIREPWIPGGSGEGGSGGGPVRTAAAGGGDEVFQVQGDITVVVQSSPGESEDELADKVLRGLQRKARRGGGSPFQVITR